MIGSLPHKESRVQDDHDDTDTPGWDAINAALAPLYAGQ
ncbi:suppressor of fused domain protein, partial [Mesorhizobium sp. M1C.F.Ca.ET.187.01.1.1]